MKKRTLAGFVFSVLILLSSAGCINYEQETFLNEDLSGRMEIHIFANPKPAVEEILKKVNEENKLSVNMDEALSKATYKLKFDVKEESLLEAFNKEAIKNKSFRKIEKDGIPHFYLTVEFYDIRKLFADKDMVNVTEDKKGLITYTQFFVSPKDDKKENKAADKPPEFFKGFNFKYTLHMPQDIVSANTDKIDKNMATWELPLDAIANNKNFCIMASMKGRNKFLRWLTKFRKK